MKNRTIACAVAALLAAVAQTAAAMPVSPTASMRTVSIEMDDTMRYRPAQLRVKRGEAIRIVATNRGKVLHEIVFGTRAELEAHARHMREHPEMHHDGGNMLHVPPGATREMGWRFTHAGEYLYACLLPGHFEAGMVGTVVVEP